jgi:hypothetical protein
MLIMDANNFNTKLIEVPLTIDKKEKKRKHESDDESESTPVKKLDTSATVGNFFIL